MIVPQLILILVLIVTPWCYGGIYESTQVYILGTLVVAGVAWVAASLATHEDRRFRLPLATLPLVIGLALGICQLLPLPRFVAGIVIPHTVQLREQLLSEPASGNNNDSGKAQANIQHTISLRPAATRSDLTRLTMAVAAFLLGTQVFCSAESRLGLCLAVAANGAVFSFFGIVQKLSWNGNIYWTGLPAGNPFAAFLNRNNGGGYLNLCLAAALALLFWAARRKQTWISSGRPRRGSTGRRKSYARRPGHPLSSWVDVDARVLAVAALAAVMVGGIVGSLSRGAVVSLLGACAITALIPGVTGKGQQRWAGPIGVVLAGIGLAVWLGMHDALWERFGTLTAENRSAGRLPNWLDALQSLPDFWRTGSGLGTYRDVYVLYQQRFDPIWYYHAENQYLQSVVEGGMAALLLLLAAILLVSLASWKVLRYATGPADYGLAVGLVFGLASQVIHGFFDFGLYMPANMLLLAVLCGVVAARAREIDLARPWATTKRESQAPAEPCVSNTNTQFSSAGASHSRKLRSKNTHSRVGYAETSQAHTHDRHGSLWAHLTVGTVLVFALVLSLVQLRSIAATTGALGIIDYPISPAAANPDELQDVISSVESQLPLDEAELHYELAKAWIQLYRIRSLAKLRESAPSTISVALLWEQTSPGTLHRRAHEFMRQGDSRQLESLRNEELVKNHLHPALEHLLLARRFCPILANTHLRIARLSFLVEEPARDAVHVARARMLAPADCYTLAECGLLDAHAGRLDDARQSWRHCLALSPDYSEQVIEYATPFLDLATIVQDVLPDDPALLVNLAQRTTLDIGTQNQVNGLLLQHARSLVPTSKVPEAERHYLLATAFSLEGRNAEAMDEYALAVEGDPWKIAWRHAYGQLLFQEERFDEAREQIRRCAQSEPDSPVYRQLLEQIHEARLRN